MKMMNSYLKASLFALVALGLLLVLLAAGAQANDQQASDSGQKEVTATSAPAAGVGHEPTSARAKFEPAKLFDFENYKRLFSKTYSSLLEEVARKKYFLSRAFRAFISAIKYKYRQASYYLALNWLSDSSPRELELMQNTKLEDEVPKLKRLEDDQSEHEQDGGSGEQNSDLPELLPAEGQDVEGALQRLVESNPSGPGFDELRHLMGHAPSNEAGAAGAARDEQDALAAGQADLRPLPLERLVDTGEQLQLNAETARKVKLQVASDNPSYEPIDLASFGLKDEQKKVTFWEIGSRNDSMVSAQSFATSLWDKFSSLGTSIKGNPVGAADGEPDQVFLDLRETNCFFMPRLQGRCGACYAFSMIAIIEWLYCMKTGNLVAFSEQYMIDCGKSYTKGLAGCTGGTAYGVARFVHNFGLELRIKYPYMMAEEQCPYEADMDLAKTGYIRFEFEDALQVHLDVIPKLLKNGPMLLGISTAAGFHEYGGGVHGFGCDQEKPSHAVVLIGHGREDGLEYWLIRNSYSVGWGEAGHYKLAKAANCIPSKFGHLYATRDGVRRKHKIKPNVRNVASNLKRHYAKRML